MDRAYIIPCQKNNFNSCEGCPKVTCGTKHFSRLELQTIRI